MKISVNPKKVPLLMVAGRPQKIGGKSSLGIHEKDGKDEDDDDDTEATFSSSAANQS